MSHVLARLSFIVLTHTNRNKSDYMFARSRDSLVLSVCSCNYYWDLNAYDTIQFGIQTELYDNVYDNISLFIEHWANKLQFDISQWAWLSSLRLWSFCCCQPKWRWPHLHGHIYGGGNRWIYCHGLLWQSEHGKLYTILQNNNNYGRKL